MEFTIEEKCSGFRVGSSIMNRSNSSTVSAKQRLDLDKDDLTRICISFKTKQLWQVIVLDFKLDA